MSRFCNYFAIFLIFSSSLQGCGGGGSSSPALNVSGGVYSNTANGDEIITILAPETLISSPTPNWFGIKFTNGNNYPDLYTSRVTGVGTPTATGSTTTKHFQGISSPRTGASASLTMPLNTRLSSTISIDSTPQENALTLNWLTDQLGADQYAYAATASSLTGTWIGKWYFGVNTSNDKSLILSAGSVTGSQSVITDCNLDNTQITPLSGANLYEVTLYVSINTNCTLSNSNTQATLYKGLAFVINNPIPGKTSRLQLMASATDGSHKAVFFRGDQ